MSEKNDPMDKTVENISLSQLLMEKLRNLIKDNPSTPRPYKDGPLSDKEIWDSLESLLFTEIQFVMLFDEVLKDLTQSRASYEYQINEVNRLATKVNDLRIRQTNQYDELVTALFGIDLKDDQLPELESGQTLPELTQSSINSRAKITTPVNILVNQHANEIIELRQKNSELEERIKNLEGLLNNKL